jgi:peroxiredoxin
MKRLVLGFAALALIAVPAAHAALAVGAKAPDFTAPAAMDGKDFTYKLADGLKKGPVIVYFFPKANTGTCDLEAHAFADKIADFKALGATVVGISRDDLPTLATFSTAKCASAFPVASDEDGKISGAFDAKLPVVKYSNRVSYVVAPDGTVIYEYAALGQSHEHAENTLAALKDWRAKHKS